MSISRGSRRQGLSLKACLLFCFCFAAMVLLPTTPGRALASWLELEAQARGVLTEANAAFTKAQEDLKKVANPDAMTDADRSNMGSALLALTSAERAYKDAEDLLRQTKASLVTELKNLRKAVKKSGDDAAKAQLEKLDAYVKALDAQIEAVREHAKKIEDALAPLQKVKMPQ
eukprot:TRINITY_DN112333_c0_g1_i1.p1 TRINITY_DN112333_c0_g1~~TRINITY_DN112333_c0_g1_i1.p1  ORF type:complete len:196 (-),score=47.21 TRINITY_DN112333_c0_g1_i1:292-810(-)